jgi:predicted amidohydrolase YtcJ
MKSARQISGLVWTGDGEPERRIIETSGGRISAVLPAGAKPLDSDALVLPANALLVPGLHDAHLHFLFGGLKLGACSFSGVASVAEFQARLEDYVRSRDVEPGTWIQGLGLDESRVQTSRLEIDRVVPNHPVFIWSHDLHSGFVNTAGLVRARLDSTVQDPPGGEYKRDASGLLSGVLREGAAMALERAIPPATNDEAAAGMRRAQDYALSLGITAVTSSVHAEFIPHYLNFAQSGDRKLRLNVWRVSEHFDLTEDLFERRIATGFRLATLKGFADGALGSRTGAFWQPYTDGGGAGMPLVREGPLARWARAAQQEGYQLAIHAIGDRANSICLDAIEMAGFAGRGPEYRPRLEHAQHLRERDLARFAELGVIASMQPIHCTSDMHMVEPRLGADRARFAYAWRRLLDHGAALAFGSDWPVDDLSPIAGIHAAVTRQSSEDEPAAGWHPQERITVAEALRAYTRGAANAAFWDDRMGAIAEGMLADFTVLSQNIFACEPREIKNTKILQTTIGGEIVYEP